MNKPETLEELKKFLGTKIKINAIPGMLKIHLKPLPCVSTVIGFFKDFNSNRGPVLLIATTNILLDNVNGWKASEQLDKLVLIEGFNQDDEVLYITKSCYDLID